MTPISPDEPFERVDILHALIAAKFPIDPLRAKLRAYPWDVDEPLITLHRSHVDAILSRFLGGEVTAADVLDWANALELRDDIGLVERDQQLLERLIFQLANPEVNGVLTMSSAEAMRANLARDSA